MCEKIQLSGAMLLLVLAAACLAANPVCRQLCDDPICEADCKPLCEPAACTYQCTDPSTKCFQPQCTVDCDDTQTASDECPSCETKCEPLVCFDRSKSSQCNILCEALSCGWDCSKPQKGKCKEATCVWECERPVCEKSHGSKIGIACIILFSLMFVHFQ